MLFRTILEISPPTFLPFCCSCLKICPLRLHFAEGPLPAVSPLFSFFQVVGRPASYLFFEQGGRLGWVIRPTEALALFFLHLRSCELGELGSSPPRFQILGLEFALGARRPRLPSVKVYGGPLSLTRTIFLLGRPWRFSPAYYVVRTRPGLAHL